MLLRTGWPGEPFQALGALPAAGLGRDGRCRPGGADEAWEQLRAAHPDLLGSLRAAIMHTDTGTEEAAINRLVVGAFDTKTAAQELCARLKQRNVDCFVPRP